MSSSGGNKDGPPGDTEVEVSFFGPGFGECLVLCLGEGEWAIIDSCVTPEKGQPAALQYLERIGVDVATAVKLVVVTHWHDDHVRGIGAVFRACPSARFYCSAALRDREVSVLIELYGQDLLLETIGVSELAQVIEELKRRRNGGASKEFVSPEFLMANRLVWRRNGGAFPVEISALSPSSAALGVGQGRLSQLTKTPRNKRLPDLSPNHASVVLWLKAGAVDVLLGSDLEERGDPGLGWQAIVDSATRIDGRASAFKVAHHGSENGYHEAVWETLLEPKPVSVITPFVRGKTSLPQKAVTELILERSGSAFLTAYPLTRKSPRRQSATSRVIKRSVRWIRQVQPVQGQVRLRRDALDASVTAWQIETFGAAISLEKFISATTKMSEPENP